MKTVEKIKTIASEAGYATVVHFPLPPSAWRADYYSPLLSRLPALEHQYRDNAEAEAIISLTQQEIELFEKHSDEYGYEFFLLKNKE